MLLDIKKLAQLGKKVYNEKADMIFDKEQNKYIASNNGYIKQLCEKVFGDGSVTPDPSLLHQFNNILVQTADYVAEPSVKALVELFADFKQVKPTETVVWNIPQHENKPKFMLGAVGSTADMIRITQEMKYAPASRHNFEFGCYYNRLDFCQDSVDTFNDTINKIAEAKVKKYYELIMQCINGAVKLGNIPKGNIWPGSNISLSDFRKYENRFIRWGGQPVLVADMLLIDHLVDSEVQIESPMRTNELVNEVREKLQIQKVSRTTTINMNNPFIDMEGTKTQYPVNTGYMFAGALQGKKPIQIAEYGGMIQNKVEEAIDGRIKLQVSFEAAVDLIYGRLIGKITDDTIKLEILNK